MLRILTAVLVLALPLAGCLGKDEPVESADIDVAPNATSSVARNASAPLADEAADMPPVTMPVSYAGSTPTGACIFATGECHWTQEGTEDYHKIEHVGTPQRLLLNVTYGEQEPGMTFYVALCRGEGEDESTVECPDYVTAPSPIVLDVDLRSDAPGTVYGISVGSVSDAPAAAGVGMLFGPADFSVEGAMTLLPAH